MASRDESRRGGVDPGSGGAGADAPPDGPALRNPVARVRRAARDLVASGFVRDVGIVAGGSVAAQIVALAFAPLLARLYSPEAFGVVGIFMAAFGWLAPLATLSYGQAVVLPRTDAQSRALARLCVLLGFASGGAALALLLGLHAPLAELIGFAVHPALLLLLPLAMLLQALRQATRQWLTRKRRFAAQARIEVIVAAIANGSKGAVGAVAASPVALLLLTVAADAVQTFLLLREAMRAHLFGKAARAADAAAEATAHETTGTASDPGAEVPDPPMPRQATPTPTPTHTGALAVARLYRDFPVYRLPQTWLNAVGSGLPTLVVAGFFGPAAAGFLAIAQRVLGLPGTLILRAFGMALMPRVLAARDAGESPRPLLLRSTLALAALGLPPFGLLIAFGPTLFGFVFGAQWTTAGSVAGVMAVWTYAHFVSVPAIQLIPLLGMQRWLLGFELLTLPLQTGALLLGAIVFDDLLATVLCYAATIATTQTILVAAVFRRTADGFRERS